VVIIIYNDSLINFYSQTNLNLELLSFYNDWKMRYLKAVENSSPLKEAQHPNVFLTVLNCQEMAIAF